VETYDNNGGGYPVQDSVLYLPELSCDEIITDLHSPWNLTVSAAVRKDRSTLPVNLDISFGVPRVGTVVDGFQDTSVPMESWGSLSDEYDLFRVSYAGIPGNNFFNDPLEFNVASDDFRDNIKHTSDLLQGSTC